MFTHTVDTALDRWTADDGYEFAYSHDYDADSPFDWGWEGMYVMPFDSRRMDAGDEQIRRVLDAWADDLETLEYEVETARADKTWDLAALEADLAAHLEARPEIETFEYDSWQVFVDLPVWRKDWGYPDDATLEDMRRHLEGNLDTYKSWCNGEVYVAGVTTPDGDTEYLGGIYLDPARDDREQIEEIMRDFV